MSTIERVSQLSHRIFNTTANEKNVRRSSNPFAASNFQKNILTEDVFESSNKSKDVNFAGGISQSSKRIYSTFVGSINDFGKNIAESVKEFGMKIKNGITSAWNKVVEIGNIEIHPMEGLKNGYHAVKDTLQADIGSLLNPREKLITKMSAMDPQTEIKPMLNDAIKALSEELSQAA